MKIKNQLLTTIMVTLLWCNANAQSESAIQYEIDNNRLKNAVEMANAAVAADPGNGKLYYMLGKANMLEGNSAAAKDAFSKGKDKTVAGWMNTIGLGWLALNDKDTIKANQLFQEAIGLVDKKNAEVYFLIGESYFYADPSHPVKAIQYIEKGIAMKQFNLEAYIAQGDAYLTQPDGGGKALTAYEDAETKFKDSPAPAVKIARLYMNARNYPLALEYINKSLELDPSFVPAHKLRGDYNFNLKKYEESRASYEKALSLSDSTDELLTQYLYACFLSKDYETTYALSSKLKGSAINPFVLNRAEAYSLYEIGKYEESLESINKLFSNPDKDRFIKQDYLYYGKILSKNKQDSLAIEVFEQAYQQDTTDTDPLVEMSKSYAAMGNYNMAAACYQRKAQAEKANALDYFMMGRNFYYGKSYQAADSAFAMVAEMQPAAYHGYFWRGRCNSVLDPDIKSDSTKIFYEKAIELASADPAKNKRDLIESYQYLGFYYVKKDRNNEAIANFRKILELDPDNKEAKNNINVLQQKQ